jgi:CarboxypepD_reg-like domain
MRTTNRILLLTITTIILLSSNFLNAQNEGKDYNIYKGIVIDKNTKEPLLFASVALQGTNIATVTNSEGEFVIKTPKEINEENLEFSYLGYKTTNIPLNSLKSAGNIISIEATSIALNEIQIRPDDPFHLVRNSLYSIPNNYSKDANKMTAFYREIIKKRNHYVSISEAVLDIYKSPYNTAMKRDLVKIFKGRKSTEKNKIDTVLFKVQGGPNSTLLLDIVKNPYVLLDEAYFDDYEYSLERLTKINERLTYVIGFKQKPHIKHPMYYGKFYIDMSTMAITAVEFDLNLDDKFAASQLFIKKKPLKLSLIPLQATYRVNYKEDNEKWYFNYARCDVKFKCKWKTKLFNTIYATSIEMAITDRDEGNAVKFAVKDRLMSNEILTDKVQSFADDNYWGEYNTIEPEQSIQNAINKIGKKTMSSRLN